MALYNISLQATLLSESEGKWLVTSKNDGDLPAAFTVDTAVKDALLFADGLYRSHPTAVTACIKKHYKAIVSAVHSFEAQAAGTQAPPEWATPPLIGITEADKAEDSEEYSVKYVLAGEAVRYLKGTVDAELYAGLSYIASDWSENPALWYFVLTKYMAKFKSHIETESEENG